jgi:hypothetical protein
VLAGISYWGYFITNTSRGLGAWDIRFFVDLV